MLVSTGSVQVSRLESPHPKGMMMNPLRTSAALACLVLSGCSMFAPHHDDHDAMMGSISSSHRKTIDAARANHDATSDKLAKARQDVVRAKAEYALAKTELDLAKTKVEQAQASVVVAETGTTEELDQAREQHALAVAAVAPQHELLRWRECDIARSERAEALAQCSQTLAAAQVELEKARAFEETDQAASRDVDVAKHEALVNEATTRESVARVELDGAERQCKLAERAYDESARVHGTK